MRSSRRRETLLPAARRWQGLGRGSKPLGGGWRLFFKSQRGGRARCDSASGAVAAQLDPHAPVLIQASARDSACSTSEGRAVAVVSAAAAWFHTMMHAGACTLRAERQHYPPKTCITAFRSRTRAACLLAALRPALLADLLRRLLVRVFERHASREVLLHLSNVLGTVTGSLLVCPLLEGVELLARQLRCYGGGDLDVVRRRGRVVGDAGSVRAARPAGGDVEGSGGVGH
jgi:hypothetical protein